ncbi:hypothetical protein H2248_000233 [Termitomyces sp. 'cryptogamus']|nr:hypothetical protein H2248_000233 [Termitomyces sp. 'cryptogamus']
MYGDVDQSSLEPRGALLLPFDASLLMICCPNNSGPVTFVATNSKISGRADDSWLEGYIVISGPYDDKTRKQNSFLLCAIEMMCLDCFKSDVLQDCNDIVILGQGILE